MSLSRSNTRSTRATLAFLAVAVFAVVAADGCIAASGHSRPGPRTGKGVWQSSSKGNDSTCVRGVRRRPCRTVKRACALARSGDIIHKDGVASSYASTCRPAVQRYVASTGTDTGNCSTPTTACLTLGYAYLQAPPGATVLVACGNYGAQQIGFDPTKADSTRYVTFKPAAPGVCWNQTAGISIGDPTSTSPQPSYIELDHVAYHGGITVREDPQNAAQVVDYVTKFTGDHIVIDGQNGGRFDASGATNFLVENSDTGNCASVYYGKPGAGGVGNVCGNRVLGGVVRSSGSIVNTATHDVQGDASPDCITYSQCHTTGYFLRGTNGVLVDRDSFWNDDTADIRIQDSCSCAAQEPSNITIQNSWFGRVANGQGVGISDDTGVSGGLVIRFNSMSSAHPAGDYPGGFLLCTGMGTNATAGKGGSACGTNADPARIYGNLMTQGGCATDADYSYNVVISHSPYTGTSRCGATDILYGQGGRARFPYLNDPTNGRPNFNIAGRIWIGDNRVPVKRVRRYPRTDFHGSRRSIWRGRLDAGAVQRMAPQPRRKRRPGHRSRRRRS